ncbi:MAG: hypothetical protein ACWA5W_08850, partial [Phycisphaerales bacterium]
NGKTHEIQRQIGLWSSTSPDSALVFEQPFSQIRGPTTELILKERLGSLVARLIIPIELRTMIVRTKHRLLTPHTAKQKND